MGPHALRHTHATLVSEAATETEMLALQRRLGHASSSQTAYYVRPGAEIQERLADRIDERLRGEGSGG